MNLKIGISNIVVTIETAFLAERNSMHLCFLGLTDKMCKIYFAASDGTCINTALRCGRPGVSKKESTSQRRDRPSAKYVEVQSNAQNFYRIS